MTIQTLLLSTAVFSLALLGMAVGVLLGGRRLQGSCGGLAGLCDAQGNPICEGCDDPSPECRGLDDSKERAARSGATKQERNP